MQARRAVLAFAIALMLAAAVASIAPPPPPPGAEGGPAAPPSEPVPRPGSAAPGAGRTVELRLDAAARRRVERRIPRGARVVLTVGVPEPGEVEVDGLGLLAGADASAPAVFDLLAERPGRFDVRFSPIEGRDRRVATLVVE